MIWRIWEDINSKRLVEIEGYNYQLTEIDLVYLFTDVDHYEDELRELLVNDKNYGEHWIISNPDFEIWLYYCFRNQPDDDFSCRFYLHKFWREENQNVVGKVLFEGLNP